MERDYHLFEEVFLRVPLYSYEDYRMDKLDQVISDPLFRNAIWLASPAFYRELQKKQFAFRLMSDKELFALYKYYNRMSFRATPFGLFSSFTLAHWTDSDIFQLTNIDDAILHLFPAQELLTGLSAEKGVWADDKLLTSNPTLYRLADSFRYFRSTRKSLGTLSYVLEALAAEQFNKDLISFLKTPQSGDKVVRFTMSQTACKQKDAVDFIDFLLDAEVIYGSNSAPVISNRSGKLFVGTGSLLVSELHALPASESMLRLHHPSTAPPADVTAFYRALERKVQAGGIHEKYQKQLTNAIDALSSLSIPYQAENLKNFIASFKVRFERQKVPLLTALDPDAGIVYGGLQSAAESNSWLDDLSFKEQEPIALNLRWDGLRQLFLRLWFNNRHRKPVDEICLSDNDLNSVNNQPDGRFLPPTLAVLFRLADGHVVIDSAGGASATALVSRFNFFSDEILGFTRKIAASETAANPEVIFADIAHASGSHVDNINRRRPVYDYLIPLNTYPEQNAGQLIMPDDLVVFAYGDELIMESVKLKKRIIPRLTSAFNFNHNDHPVFRLLCDLQYQGLLADLNIDLEVLFPGLSFYPRISYRQVVIASAKWILDKTEIEALTAVPHSIGRLHLFIQGRSIPLQLMLGTGDQLLSFDLSDDLQARFFLNCLQGRPTAILRENFQPDQPSSPGRKKMAGQLIAFLHRSVPVYRYAPTSSSTEAYPQRSYSPGSEWLYLKLYCTAQSSNKLLLDAVRPFLQQHRQLIDSWFFIRYVDKGYHLRLRVRLNPKCIGDLLVAFRKQLSADPVLELVSDFAIETYQRELERYGINLIGQAENFFYAGSMFALDYLQTKSNGAAGNEEIAFLYVYEIIRAFTGNEMALEIFLTQMTGSFLDRFEQGKKLMVGMGKNYRTIQRKIQMVIEQPDHSDAFLTIKSSLTDVVLKMAALAAEARQLPQTWQTALLADLVHMEVNRLFSSRQLHHEAFLYYCLNKYQLSAAARTRRSINPGPRRA